MKSIFSLPEWQQAILSGVLLGIAFQPWHLGWLAWIGFIPLFHIWLHGNVKDNFIFGCLFGLTQNFIAVYWIGFNSGASVGVVLLSLVAAVIYLALFWGVVGLIIGFLPNKSQWGIVLLPFLIVTMEWVRSFGPLGFPWINLALTQSEYIFLTQIGEITGPYGISFWIIAINTLIYLGIIRENMLRETMIAVLVLLIGLSIAGWGRLHSISHPHRKIKVAIVQPNVDPNSKWDEKDRIIALMDSLHQAAVNLDPDIVLFPETAIPVYLRLNSRVRKMLQDRVDRAGIPLLTGTVDRKIEDGKRYYYNSAIWLSPDSDYEMYAKVHLVPFAEYDLLPFLFHPLRWLNLNIERGSFRAGKEYKVFEWDGVRFSDLICYESSIPKIVRRFIGEGAEILMIEANDGWLGNTAGPYQHFELARLRAIENRVPVLRSANTGISGVIRPDGTVQKKVPLGKQAVFIEEISIGEPGSFYSRYGDVFAAFCFVTSCVLVILSWQKK